MKNNPLLFVNTVSSVVDGSENLDLFDSRKYSKKKVCKHRLDDIKAMLLYKINILCIVKTSDMRVEGIVYDVDESYLNILSEDKNILINIEEIEDINILKI